MWFSKKQVGGVYIDGKLVSKEIETIKKNRFVLVKKQDKRWDNLSFMWRTDYRVLNTFTISKFEIMEGYPSREYKLKIKYKVRL